MRAIATVIATELNPDLGENRSFRREKHFVGRDHGQLSRRLGGPLASDSWCYRSLPLQAATRIQQARQARGSAAQGGGNSARWRGGAARRVAEPGKRDDPPAAPEQGERE